MQNLEQKSKKCAQSMYLLPIVNLMLLLVSRKEHERTPLARHHMKVAFTIHSMMMLVMFVMSYPILNKIIFLNLSLNDIITRGLLIVLLGCLLFGMYKAHKGESVFFREMLERGKISQKYFEKRNSDNVSQDESGKLVLAHIPFIGFMLYGRNSNIAHMRDIITLNLLVTLCIVGAFISGMKSLSQIILLAYIIYSVFISILLIKDQSCKTMNLDYIPSMKQLSLLTHSSLSFILQSLQNKDQVHFQEIYNQHLQAYEARYALRESQAQSAKASRFNATLAYVPLLNLLLIFEKGRSHMYHKRNGLLLTLLMCIHGYIMRDNLSVLLLYLFPISFAIGYRHLLGYQIPFLDTLELLIEKILLVTRSIFKKGNTLRKTHTKEKIIISQKSDQNTEMSLKKEDIAKNTPD